MHPRFLGLVVLAQAASLALGSAVPRAENPRDSEMDELAKLAQQAAEAAKDDVNGTAAVRRGVAPPSCTLGTLSIRREW